MGLLQAALLPELPARLGPVGTTAAYRPASGPAAGGDFYDVFALSDGRVAVIVGDVSGHGREALPHTTLLRFTLRAYLEAGLSPRESLRTAAPVLERQLGGSFATVVLATYDPRERLLTYSCAGPPAPDRDGPGRGRAEHRLLGAADRRGAADRAHARRSSRSRARAVACFYTDGVIEARVQGELFGAGRLAASLAALGARRPSASGLLDRVSEETDRAARRHGGLPAGSRGRRRCARGSRCEEIELSARELQRDRVEQVPCRRRSPRWGDRLECSTLHARSLSREGSALLKIRLGEGSPAVMLTHDNVAPLSARAIARSQEVAL